MTVAARVCMSVTQRQETEENLSQNCITKMFRDLRDTHAHSTELERSSACKFGVSVSHVLRTWYFADSNALGGSLCWQPQRSHVQMAETLQTSPASHSSGTSAVGTYMTVHVLSARHEQSLDVLRFTRGCCGIAFGEPLSALCTLCFALAASARNPPHHTDVATDVSTQ